MKTTTPRAELCPRGCRRLVPPSGPRTGARPPARPEAGSRNDSGPLRRPGAGARRKGEEGLPRRLPASPLGLGSLEHEFGGLHVGVLGHGSGDTSPERLELAEDQTPRLERGGTREAHMWRRSTGPPQNARRHRRRLRGIPGLFHPNTESQIELYFLFTVPGYGSRRGSKYITAPSLCPRTPECSGSPGERPLAVGAGLTAVVGLARRCWDSLLLGPNSVSERVT